MRSFGTSRIAVVEDDASLREDLVEFLVKRGLAAQGFDSAESFYRGMAAADFGLVLLDILLPGESGLDVACWLRSHLPGMGIVMLTSLSTSRDQVGGLQAGADAYLAKNAPLEVIEATCASVLRRLASASPPPADAVPSTWRLNPYTHQLWPPLGEMIELTHADAMFLEALIQSPGQVVSRQVLLARQGKPDGLNNLRNLDSQARRIRQKVLAASGTELPVKPSYGIGYLFAGDAALIDRRARPWGSA